MRRVIVLALAAAFLVAGCTTAVIVHDRRLGFGAHELERTVPVGASEQEAMRLLTALADDPPTGTELIVYGAEDVTQTWCSPRPCSLADQGVPIGHRALTVRASTDGYWIPRVCMDEYIADFIFDEQGRYYDFIKDDAMTCL